MAGMVISQVGSEPSQAGEIPGRCMNLLPGEKSEEEFLLPVVRQAGGRR